MIKTNLHLQELFENNKYDRSHRISLFPLAFFHAELSLSNSLNSLPFWLIATYHRYRGELHQKSFFHSIESLWNIGWRLLSFVFFTFKIITKNRLIVNKTVFLEIKRTGLLFSTAEDITPQFFNRTIVWGVVLSLLKKNDLDHEAELIFDQKDWLVLCIFKLFG